MEQQSKHDKIIFIPVTSEVEAIWRAALVMKR
jgi:hypothetical protein